MSTHLRSSIYSLFIQLEVVVLCQPQFQSFQFLLFSLYPPEIVSLRHLSFALPCQNQDRMIEGSESFLVLCPQGLSQVSGSRLIVYHLWIKQKN